MRNRFIFPIFLVLSSCLSSAGKNFPQFENSSYLGSFPLSPFEINSLEYQELKPIEIAFRERRYGDILKLYPWASLRNNEERYLFLRSAYVLKDWNMILSVAGSSHRKDAILGPYIRLYEVFAFLEVGKIDAAKNHYRVHKDSIATLIEKDAIELLEVKLALQDNTMPLQMSMSMNAEYWYEKYQLTKSQDDFLQAIKAGSPKALKEAKSTLLLALDTKELTEYFLSVLKEVRSDIFEKIATRLQRLDLLFPYYLEKRKYTALLQKVNASQPEYFRPARIYTHQIGTEEVKYALEHKNSALIRTILQYYYSRNQWEKIRALYSQEATWNAYDSFHYLLLTMVKNEKYQDFKPILKKIWESPTHLSVLNRTSVGYWLYFLYQKDGQIDLAQEVKTQMLRKYPFSFHAIRLYEQSTLEEQQNVSLFWKSKENLSYESIPQLQAWKEKLKSFPRKDPLLQRAIFFAKVMEDQKAVENMRAFTRKYKVSLYEFIPEIIPLMYQAHRPDYNNLYVRILLDHLYQLTNRAYLYRDVTLAYFPLLYLDIILDASKYVEIPPSWIQGIILQETSYHPYAVSGDNARGLMQVVPMTSKPILNALKRNNVFQREIVSDISPPENIYTGSIFFKDIYRRLLKNIPEEYRLMAALASYNAGPARIMRSFDANQKKLISPEMYIDTIPFGESRFYTKKIYQNIFIYKELDAWKTKHIS